MLTLRCFLATAFVGACASGSEISDVTKEQQPENCFDLPCPPPGCMTPIIIDTSGDGFDLTHASDGVVFAVDPEREIRRIAWTYANDDDGWLVLDRNGNGDIDDGYVS